jgi:hypothetical protein
LEYQMFHVSLPMCSSCSPREVRRRILRSSTGGKQRSILFYKPAFKTALEGGAKEARTTIDRVGWVRVGLEFDQGTFTCDCGSFCVERGRARTSRRRFDDVKSKIRFIPKDQTRAYRPARDTQKSVRRRKDICS